MSLVGRDSRKKDKPRPRLMHWTCKCGAEWEDVLCEDAAASTNSVKTDEFETSFCETCLEAFELPGLPNRIKGA